MRATQLPEKGKKKRKNQPHRSVLPKVAFVLVVTLRSGIDMSPGCSQATKQMQGVKLSPWDTTPVVTHASDAKVFAGPTNNVGKNRDT